MVNNAIRKRKAFLTEKALLNEALEIMNGKENALATLALFQKLKDNRKQISLNKLTNHFKSQFCRGESIPEETGYFKLVSSVEIDRAKMKLKNNKAPGPDALKGEDIKSVQNEEIRKSLNKMILDADKSLTTGYLVPISKPVKDPNKKESHRPVILLSTYRKLLSQLKCNRINPDIDQSLLPS